MQPDREAEARRVLAKAYENARDTAPQNAGVRFHAANVRVIGKRDYADWKDHAALAAMLAFADAARREALEDAAGVADRYSDAVEYLEASTGMWIAKDIRALPGAKQ